MFEATCILLAMSMANLCSAILEINPKILRRKSLRTSRALKNFVRKPSLRMLNILRRTPTLENVG
jgi:hypothetical protein